MALHAMRLTHIVMAKAPDARSVDCVRLVTQAVSGESVWVAQGVTQYREGGGALTSARVVEVVARVWRTPVRKYTHQSTRLDVCLHQIFRHVGQA